MVSSEQTITQPSRGAPGRTAPARARLADRLTSDHVAPLVLGCFILALVSVLALSWVPSSDPWAWIDWGQEIASSKVSLSLGGGPSWKPFPVVFTSVFGLFGNAAPHLWLLVSRTAGLLAFVAAFRLGRRFAGLVGGVIAVIALFFMQDWLFYLARGASEPIVACLTLWAIDRHLAGSPRAAYVLAFLATLNRPEFSPFLALYALYLWLRVPRSRILAVALLVLVPIAWFVPPWEISGNAFQAGSAALGGKGSPGTAWAELKSSVGLMTWPILVLAGVGFVLAIRRRDRTLTWLGIGAIAWALMVAVITQVAYGLPRYLLPGAVIACLLAGYAVVQLATLVGNRFPRRDGTGRARWPAIAAGALILAATLPWSIPRVHALVRQGHQADQAAFYLNRMFTAADQVGGAARVLPCRSSQVAVNHTMASALAWKLQVPEHRIRPLMRAYGFVFSAPHTQATGTTPPIVHPSARTIRTIALVPPWKVYEVTARGASATPHCASGDYSTGA
jgi:hypothetical protein